MRTKWKRALSARAQPRFNAATTNYNNGTAAQTMNESVCDWTTTERDIMAQRKIAEENFEILKYDVNKKCAVCPCPVSTVQPSMGRQPHMYSVSSPCFCLPHTNNVREQIRFRPLSSWQSVIENWNWNIVWPFPLCLCLCVYLLVGIVDRDTIRNISIFNVPEMVNIPQHGITVIVHRMRTDIMTDSLWYSGRGCGHRLTTHQTTLRTICRRMRRWWWETRHLIYARLRIRPTIERERMRRPRSRTKAIFIDDLQTNCRISETSLFVRSIFTDFEWLDDQRRNQITSQDRCLILGDSPEASFRLS